MATIKLNRRKMIAASGAVAAPMIIPATVFGQNAPSNKLNLGCIGMGGQGVDVNLKMFLWQDDCRVATVCDAFLGRAQRAKALVDEAYGNSDCKAVQDFREVLADPAVDAVVISTPDHWHVPMSLMALKAGKHVFCEKPTHSIHEGRELIEAFAKSDRVFQAGIEDRSTIHFHRLCEWVKNGAIGDLERVEVMMPGGIYYQQDAPVPIPADLDWNLWQGPAEYREYTPLRTNSGCWRQISMYAKGAITDMGTHLVDTAQVGVDDPNGCAVEVTGTGDIPENMLSDVPVTYDLNYKYSNGVEMHVSNGSSKGWDPSACNIGFHGSKGWVRRRTWGGALEASDPRILRTKYDPETSKHWKMPPREQRNFLDCIKSGKDTTYTPEELHKMCTTLHMGVMGIQLGRKLKWNPKKEEFTGDAAANKMRFTPEARNWEKGA